jgi:purine-binding chemotaxis protein CheW
VKGIINLRGRIIPVIDMHCFLNKKDIEYTDRTCIVVVETQQINAGLIVDSVTDVLAIEEKDISPAPDIKMVGSSGYLLGIGKVNGQVKLLLNCDKLFNDEESTIIKEIEL